MRRLHTAIVTVAILATPAHVPSRAQGAGEAGGVTRVSRLQGSASLGRNRYVVGATVLVSRSDQGSRLFVTASDYRGRFRVDDLPDGEYRVEVRREGLLPVVKENVELQFPRRAVIEVRMQPLDGAALPAALEPTGEPLTAVAVRGRVTGRDGQPMAEIRLRFARPDGLEDPVVVRTDTAGAFELPPLAGGGWRLETRVVGFLPIRAALQLRQDTELSVSMVPQPAGYEPSPLELMPAEQPVPPARALAPPPPPLEHDTGESTAEEAAEGDAAAEQSAPVGS